MRAILFLAGILFSTTAFSQGIVKGQVVDSTNQDPIPYTKIIIDSEGIMRSTDLEGYFEISLNEGKYDMLITFGTGFLDKTITIDVKNGETLELGQLTLRSDVVGLKEIEVMSDNLDAQSQLPTPVTNITAEDFDQKMGAQEFPEMMKSTPGVFVSTIGGSFGSASVRIRGFGSENTAVLINGMPVNDMETGRVFWSNWGGMNDVTRNQQIQRGLGASKLAVSSVGGTINIITKPTEYRKGVKLQYSKSNRTYSDRLMLSMSTGQMKGGWAVTALGSTRQGWGYREGTKAEAYAYFLAASKEVNDKHLFMFTAFGAPQESWGGRSATLNSFNVIQDSLGAKNRTYNPAWGYFNGEVRNASVNKYHKPVFMLNHNWYVSEKSTLSTALYYSFGRGGNTNINRNALADNRTPIPFNLQAGRGDSTYQVQWDGMVRENSNNLDTLANVYGMGDELLIGNRSNYIVLESRNDHQWLGGITSLNHKLAENTDLTLGVDYRWYRGFHYQVVNDLLGGDFWMDRERFNYTPDNNLLRPNFAAGVGDTIGYNYNSTVGTAGFFSQIQHTINKLDLFGTATVSNTYFYRNGLFLHEEFEDTSLGLSEKKSFLNYSVKAGANYRINGRHNVFFNSGHFTRAPFFRNAFIDNRVSNRYRDNLESEVITSFEAGYGFRSPKVVANLNVYSTNWNNQSYVVGFPSEAYEGDFVNFVMSDVNALHRGVELDAKVSVINGLSLTGMASVGDWRYNGDANATVLRDPGLEVINENQTVYIDGLKVGGSAQTVAALGFHYKARKYWYVGGSANYYDNLYSDYNPETKTDPEAFFNQVERLPRAFTADIYGGKSWKVKKYFIQLKLNVNNVFNHQFIINSRQRAQTVFNPAPTPFVQYYFGRTYFVGAVLSF